MYILHVIVASLVLLNISACATLNRNPVPLDRLHDAQVVNAPNVRAFGGRLSPTFQEDMVVSVYQEGTEAFLDKKTGEKNYSALALSGGGSNGAFGAGFLYGWTLKGDRPEFKLVTGISTGALIAPYAFLGSDYDERLKAVYTTVSTSSIIEKRGLLSILARSEAFTSSTPLQRLVKANVDEKLLEDIAKAHGEGRRLYIGTTHMDAQRFVVWNMGLIATTLDVDVALDLFRKVLLASASIPTAMPPVYIDVEVDGELYDEMHTDGGTTNQVFFHGGTLDLEQVARDTGSTKHDGLMATLYVIRNGQISPSPQQVSRNIQHISTRALETVLKSASVTSLFKMYVYAKHDRSELHYVSIPQDYKSEAKEPFDAQEMKRLFDIGRQLGVSEDPWIKTIPRLGNP